jgi:hypothetical protein
MNEAAIYSNDMQMDKSQATWKGVVIRAGFGSGLDPDSIRSVDPDPYSESESGSRRAKIMKNDPQK